MVNPVIHPLLFDSNESVFGISVTRTAVNVGGTSVAVGGFVGTGVAVLSTAIGYTVGASVGAGTIWVGSAVEKLFP